LSRGWASNSTLSEIADFLRARRRIIVTSHTKPDGDAVGSTIALVRALNLPMPWSGSARAEAWYFGPQPPWLADVALDTPYRVLPSGADLSGERPDAVVVLDTGSWMQLEEIQDFLASYRDRTAVIDHHFHGDPDVGDFRYIDTAAAAACQPVGELCRILLAKPTVAALPAPIAEALYLGLATDTGWFRHSNVTHKVMDLAGELLDAGADHVRLYRVVEQRQSPARLRLLARALGSLELFDHDRIAVLTLTREDFRATGAQPGDSGGFVDFGNAIETVLVTILLTEVPSSDAGGPATKVSLRSKLPTINVGTIASALGGGGHVQAAGARPRLGIDAAKREVVRLAEEHIRKVT
jgi:phosphoesterase RecJ-like protein